MTDTLLTDFYQVLSKSAPTANSLNAEIELNAGHPIFRGHFEQMPVTPGVCQTQIIKELLQEALGQDLFMAEGSNIKFTGMIVPTQHPRVFVELSWKPVENAWVSEGRIYHESTIFTKFKGSFKSSVHGNNQ